MTVKNGLVFLFLFFCCLSFGQQDSIVSLDEVILPDYNLKKNSSSLLTNKLNDSLIENSSSLTSLLRNNTSIYFKENKSFKNPHECKTLFVSYLLNENNASLCV